MVHRNLVLPSPIQYLYQGIQPAYVEIKNRINQFLSLINPILFFLLFIWLFLRKLYYMSKTIFLMLNQKQISTLHQLF